MHLVKKIAGVKKIIKQQKSKGKTIGFVPTMGYLHEGHLFLVRIARQRSQFVVVSIFVNPTQFGSKEDFGSYPRSLKRDLKLLKKEGVNLVFYPNVKEMYSPDYKTYVEVENLSELLCGKSRPNHFQGMATIVLKLFNIVRPDIAIFGRKDYQQAVIIKHMVKDLNLDIKILIGRTIREKDGLAMSSRNTYLNSGERKNAAVLYQSLKWIKKAYRKGLRNPDDAIDTMKKMIKEKGGRIDYIQTVDKNTLRSVKKLKKGTLVAMAVYFGRARLIDNTIL